MNEPKPVIPTYTHHIKPTEHGGFHLDAGEELPTASISSDLGSMFNGVVIPQGASRENRQMLLFVCQEWMRFVEKIGWYEHTADWDQHAEVHLYDGRSTHNDGVFLELYPEVVDSQILTGEDGPKYVMLRDVWASDEDYDKDTRTMLGEFGQNVRVDDSSITTDERAIIGDLLIPIELISKVNLGWCT